MNNALVEDGSLPDGDTSRIFPVIGWEVYPRGSVVVYRDGGGMGGNGACPDVDKKVKVMSNRSLARLAFFAAEGGIDWQSMAVLTYPAIFPRDGRLVKAHLNRFLTQLRWRYPYCQYLWFLEFQARGAPHFHVLVDFRAEPADRTWLGECWPWIALSGTTNEGTPEHFKNWKKCRDVHSHYRQWSNRRKTNGLERYEVKYATKQSQKNVPKYYQNVGRFWGCSRGVRPSSPKSVVAGDEADLYKWMSDNGRDITKWRYAPKIIMNLK